MTLRTVRRGGALWGYLIGVFVVAVPIIAGLVYESAAEKHGTR